MFFGSEVEEYPQGFIDDIFKVLDAIAVSLQEKVELVSYRLKMWLKFGMTDGRVRDPQEWDG